MRMLLWGLLLFPYLISTPASAHEISGLKLRQVPATNAPSSLQLQTRALSRLSKEPSSAPLTVPEGFASSQSLNCGNDGVPTPENTLILNPLDAAGTIYSPVAGTDSLDIRGVSFSVFDGGATYPGTIAVDFWHAIGISDFGFVAGVDVPISANPGVGGASYDVDLSSFNIHTNNELMVLLSDPNAAAGKAIYPAGDSTPSCFDGASYCSVLLDGGGGGLYLYGITDATVCPSIAGNIILFDVVVEVQVDTMVSTESHSFGALKARFRN